MVQVFWTLQVPLMVVLPVVRMTENLSVEPLVPVRKNEVQGSALRSGRERVELEKETVDTAKMWGHPDRWNALREVKRARTSESERLRAVYAAREGRTKQVEGGRGWRTGRACSLAEHEVAVADEGEWQEVPLAQRRRRARVTLWKGDVIMVRMRCLEEVVSHYS